MLFLCMFCACCFLPSLLLILSWLWSLLPMALPRHCGPERHWEPGHAKVCSQLATELRLPDMGSPFTTQSLLQLLCCSLFHLILIQWSPATLPLHSDLKVPWVPKTGTHWYQWFRGSAVLSKRNIFTSFMNYSNPTVYSFTLHLSQLLITKSIFQRPNLHPHFAEAAMNQLCM